MKRKLSRDERIGSKERRTAVLRLLSRMELLEAELRSCADAQRKEEIKSEIRVLRRDQTNLSVKIFPRILSAGLRFNYLLRWLSHDDVDLLPAHELDHRSPVSSRITVTALSRLM